MDIKKTFIKLTSKTYPYGTEDQLLSFLPKDIKIDEHGNYYTKIGKDSKTIFACHLDTACKEEVKVKHIFRNNFIETDGKSILGADDKAGVTILLWLHKHKVPGTYYFFIGEEVGCIGSGQASKDVKQFKKYDRIISFDRKDTCSVITHQSWSRSCSDAFADGLINELKKGDLHLKKDDGGVYTDSAEFVNVIPECTNLSVGYYSEHTHNERQDIVFLEKLCHALLLVDWESLPTERDPKKTEYKSYANDDYEYGYGWGGSYHTTANKNSSGFNEGYGLEDFSVDPYTFNVTKKTRRSTKKKKGDDDFFINDRDFFEPLSDNDYVVPAKKFHYGILKEIYFDDRLTEEEISIVKEQYLDMENPDDVAFANHLDLIRR
jgi:hypothetical protein